MSNKKPLTQEEIKDNIDYLKYEDSFLEDLDFYLVRAIENLDVELMQLLLSNGANPNVNGWGDIESLLHELVHNYGSQRILRGDAILEAAKLLLEFGADPNITGCNNLTPVQICHSLGADEFEKLLIAFGADRSEAFPI